MVARSLPSVDSAHTSSPDTGNRRLTPRTRARASEEKEMENGKSEGFSGRRTSRRIQDRQRAEKERAEKQQGLVRKRVEVVADDGGSRKKKRGTESSKGETSPKEDDVAIGLKGSEVLESRDRKRSEEGGSSNVESTGVENGVVEQGNAVTLIERGPHAKVKEILRLFNKHYLHLIQDEETRCKKAEADKKSMAKTMKRKSKDKVVAETIVKAKAKRPDLKAISKMLEAGEILYPKKMIGNLPGIEVGHQFYSRAEMVAVGFHSHWLNGIDYMGQSYKKEYSSYTFPVAVSIVLSGMYEDDLDNADEVVYTGQGGHNLTGNKRQVRDQELNRGNMALKNSMEQNVPVRVTRGHESSSSYSGKVYTYDGLYKVVQYWAEKGISGYTVFKYRLRRLEGQPLLTTNQVHFAHGRVPQSISEIRGLVCKDITGGQEDIPIPATNLVEDPPVAPTGFIYSKSIILGQNVKLPTNAGGCTCKGECVDPQICGCAKLNSSDFPYVHRDGGRLIEAKDVIFECGPGCKCEPGCVNRTSQRGIKYRLEVFRTPKKGWAVRSWDFIPSGAPVCEYVGVLMRSEDLENVSENDYIFEIDCLQTMRGLGGRERRQQSVSIPTVHNVDKLDDQKPESGPEFCIDAGSIGNIARFINHSCEPNLFVQCVLSSHHDLKLARVMLFAADNIPPMQELTYDYGYALDSVHGPDGKVKRVPCFCGAGDCRKRLY